MYTNNDIETIEAEETSMTNFSWSEYSNYHDYFVELLSYNRKHNLCHNNIWEFRYV